MFGSKGLVKDLRAFRNSIPLFKNGTVLKRFEIIYINAYCMSHITCTYKSSFEGIRSLISAGLCVRIEQVVIENRIVI